MVLFTNYPKNDPHITNQSYNLKLNNSRKLYNLLLSCKGTIKVRRCPENSKMTLEKSNKILKSLKSFSDIRY